MRDTTRDLIKTMVSQRGYSIVEFNELKGKCLEYGLLRNGEESIDVILFLKKEQVYDKTLYPVAYEATEKRYNKTVSLTFVVVDKFMEEQNIVQYLQETTQSLGIACSFIVINLEKRTIVRSEDKLLGIISDINYCLSNINVSNEKKYAPYVTYFLMGINIFLFFIAAYLSGNIFSFSNDVLISLGAKENSLIQSGEYYRLFTCMFLHGGIVHIFFNMYALYAIGPFVEETYGKYKYLLIYIVSGILASIFSFVFTTAVSIGASGAIFGLFGAILAFGLKNRSRVNKKFLSNILSVIVINLFIGATLPGIDNFAHLGGLIGGVILSALLIK